MAKVHDNFLFSLSDVSDIVLGHSTSGDSLSLCVTNANPSYYDATWSSEIGLKLFRNYGPPDINPNFIWGSNFISPDTFTQPTQYSDYGEMRDLIDAVNINGDNNTQWIYSVDSGFTGIHTPKVLSNVTYKYGETTGTTEFITTGTTHTFTVGSTKRFVMAQQSTGTITMGCTEGSRWMIAGKNVTTFINSTCTTSGKYIHFAGSSVTSIGDSAFYNCDGLTGSLTIPNSVTIIGNSAFYSCGGLNGTLTIPNSVTIIGNSAFGNCGGLTGSLTIPSGVISIEGYTFVNCGGLTGSLTIPSGVTSIGEYAFGNCDGLTSITCYMVTAPLINTTVFNSVPKTIPFYRPSGSTGYEGTGWSEFTNKFYIE